SSARGDAGAESDLDVMIVLNEIGGYMAEILRGRQVRVAEQRNVGAAPPSVASAPVEFEVRDGVRMATVGEALRVED
ncbi:MAG: hypothetical protein WD995_10700, partial [Gemmatimonadota bacterium]